MSTVTAEARREHRVTIRTLERWEHSGRLVPMRLSPGVIRYKRTDIDRLIEEGAA